LGFKNAIFVKKQQLSIPTSEQKPSFINKQKIQKLYEIADSHGIKYENKVKKADLISLINDYIESNYFKSIEITNASHVNLFNIGMNIKHHFNNLFLNEGIIDAVIIENQISPIATRMKTIQGMIVQYFVMSNLNVKNIEFISASNKLKCCEKTINSSKTTYSERKKQGIEKCLEIIHTKNTIMWEVNIWYLIYSENKELFNPYTCNNHDDSVIYNY
jgi:hypothetical protein